MPNPGNGLDALDRRLLACLQRDNQQSAEALAEQIGLSPSALARRARRLRADGHIVADVAVVADGVLTGGAGQALRAVLQITLERHAVQAVDAFRRKLAASPFVQLCLEVTGSYDIVAVAVFATIDGFNAFVDETLAGDPIVQRYETSFVKKSVKMSLALPLAD